jgi:hypothetical protein
VRDKGNARSLFQACYSEGGNKTSELSAGQPLLEVSGARAIPKMAEKPFFIDLRCFMLLGKVLSSSAIHFLDYYLSVQISWLILAEAFNQ